MKAKFLMTLLTALFLFVLSGCSETEQPAANNNVASQGSSNDITSESSVSITGSIDVAPESIDSESDYSDLNNTSFYEPSDFAVNAITPQLEQQSEQQSVSELEQITEADNQALQTQAELKTVDEAQNLAAEHADALVDEVLVDETGDTITPLAETAVASETIAKSEIAATETVVSEVTQPETVQPLIASSDLRTYDPIRGAWIKKKQKIAGEWLIEIRSGEAYLVLGEDFKTRSAPDLKFVLSKTSVEDVNSKNALDGSLFVANLKSPSGEQIYKLPSNFDEYSTLLLHCEKYTKLWGAASINLRP